MLEYDYLQIWELWKLDSFCCGLCLCLTWLAHIGLLPECTWRLKVSTNIGSLLVYAYSNIPALYLFYAYTHISTNTHTNVCRDSFQCKAVLGWKQMVDVAPSLRWGKYWVWVGMQNIPETQWILYIVYCFKETRSKLIVLFLIYLEFILNLESDSEA